MKKSIKGILAICVIVLLSSCTGKSLSVQITNHKEDTELVLIKSGLDEQVIAIDENGVGLLQINDMEKGYATLYYGPYSRLIWIDPSSDIILSFNGDKFAEELNFEGSTAQINDYLNKSELKDIMINDCSLEESAFIAKADSLLKDNLQKLNEAQLPQQFMNIESKRLIYFTNSAFTFYPEFYPRFSGDKTYTPSESYLNKVKELLVIDDSYLDLKEYKDFLKSALSLLARREFPEISSSIDRNIAFVENNIDNELIAEFVINSNIYSYITRNGIENSDKYLEIFNRFVKNEEMKKSMDELVLKWQRIQVGSPSPDFNATDVNGKEYGLADFKGKYVYIDIWASWCGPCKKEAPYLKELEDLYKEKDIYIVSLSCDSDRDAWEKQVTEENKEGIQIILEPNSTFLEDYMIIGIPHFLMLDSEGKIINAEMSRPSSPETKVYIDSLLN